ncbi:MAG: hypothetical protein 5 [Zeugodacus cucurbitae negev-like virus]|nr:MAG: hypothetical protein 5 [Zeugodacus cucurbitae negev-like virus]
MEVSPQTLIAFAIQSVRSQLSIAKNVRLVQNRPYVLFDKSFQRINTIRIKTYRVQVDAHGRFGVLSESAQRCFEYQDFLEVFNAANDIFEPSELSFDGNSVVLRAIPKETFQP